MIPISDINPAKNTPIISRIFMISVVLTYVIIQPKTDLELFKNAKTENTNYSKSRKKLSSF